MEKSRPIGLLPGRRTMIRMIFLKIKFESIGLGWDFLDKAKVLFTDETQVDWGSVAYKCNQEQWR